MSSLCWGWGPSLPCVALLSTSRECYPSLQLLGPWVEGLGWGVLRPRSPLPSQASTLWLPAAAAAEVNEGGLAPRPAPPCATENCNLASLSNAEAGAQSRICDIKASQGTGGPPGPHPPLHPARFPQAWIRPRQLGGGGGPGSRGPPGRGPRRRGPGPLWPSLATWSLVGCCVPGLWAYHLEREVGSSRQSVGPWSRWLHPWQPPGPHRGAGGRL